MVFCCAMYSAGFKELDVAAAAAAANAMNARREDGARFGIPSSAAVNTKVDFLFDAICSCVGEDGVMKANNFLMVKRDKREGEKGNE